MPLMMQGVYADNPDERAYEFESSYYLTFHIHSALASLSHLETYADCYDWESRCEYYHYYSDHLLYSLGQIANRFLPGMKDKEIDKERKEANRTNYCFSEIIFPILSDKKARNTIEHIDEYNHAIILSQKAVGGFNVIDSQTDPELVDQLRKRKDCQPYTLDLLRKELYIRRKEEDLVLPFVQLQQELLSLQNNVKSFMDFLPIL